MKNILKKLKEKIGLKIYNLARQAYLKKSICNIGRIVEEEDKIICYVEQTALDRYKGNYPIYNLMLHGMNQVTEGIKETVENFKLNKPVYYIFDGITFNTAIKFTSRWCYVIFKNCTFDKNIGIIWGDEITFQNNKYSDHCPLYHYGDCFLTGNRIKKITFINEQFVNNYELKQYSHPTQFGIKLDSQIIEFIDSRIDAEYPATIRIKAKKTKIENSIIHTNEFYVDSESIEFANSSIIAQNGVMIENVNCDFVGKIQAPTIFYNGIDLASKTQETNHVSKEEAALKEARQTLIYRLRYLSNYCQQLNDNKIQGIKEQLYNRYVGKVLKR